MTKINLLILAVVFVLLPACSTKKKCVDIQMLSDDSRMDFSAPNTAWFSIEIGTINLEGKNRYRSCPVDQDPTWMSTETVVIP
jgi:hypothetical protein